MKRKSSPQTLDSAPPVESDNLCKRLAEQFPADFAHWAFGVTGAVKVDKTELSREPIRADAAIFAYAELETLHAEFQTTLKSAVPVPLRFLDYYVGFKRKHPDRRVRQVLIILLPVSGPIPDRYEDERTLHVYDVIYLPEVDAWELLPYEGLLPLATLCKAESGEKLLADVAARAQRIKSRARRREIIEASRLFAGLRYDKDLINRILRESDMLEQSVIYQDILQKGEQRGLQKGKKLGLQQGVQQGVRQGVQQGVEQARQQQHHSILRRLETRLGKLSASARKRVGKLNFGQLLALGETLDQFNSEQELTAWLKRHAAA